MSGKAFHFEPLGQRQLNNAGLVDVGFAGFTGQLLDELRANAKDLHYLVLFRLACFHWPHFTADAIHRNTFLLLRIYKSGLQSREAYENKCEKGWMLLPIKGGNRSHIKASQ